MSTAALRSASLTTRARILAPVLAGALAAALAILAAPAHAAAGFGLIKGPGGCLQESGHGAGTCGAGNGLLNPMAVAVSPDGASVYVVGGVRQPHVAESFGSIAILRRDPTTGEVSDVGCLSSDGTDGRDGASGVCTASPSLLGADGVAVSADGHTVFVTASDSESIAAFTRDPATGLLTRLGCFQRWVQADCRSGSLFLGSSDLIASPDDSALYVASPLEGTLTEMTTAPAQSTTPATPSEPAATPPPAQTASVASLFGPMPTAQLASSCIAVNGYDGACAVGVAMKGVGGLTLSPDGKQLYAAASASEAIDVFAPLAKEPLTEIGCLKADAPKGLCNSSSLLSGPSQLAIAPDGRNVYVADDGGTGDSRVVVLTRDATTGKLADAGCVDFLPEPVKPEPGGEEQGEEEHEEERESSREQEPTPKDPCDSVPGLQSVKTLAISGDGSAVYAFGGSSLVSFSRNAGTGKLTETGCASESDSRCASIPELKDLEAAAVSPDGHNVYVATSNTNALLAFGVGASVASASASSTRAGVAHLSVACPAHLRHACKGRVVLLGRARSRGQRTHRIAAGGSRVFTVSSGRRSRVAVRVYGSAHALLLSRHRLRVTAVVHAQRRSGGSGLGRRVLLRLARR